MLGQTSYFDRHAERNVRLRGVVRKPDPAIVGSTQHACVQQAGMDVSVHTLHIAMHAARGFMDGDRSLAGKSLQQILVSGSQHPHSSSGVSTLIHADPSPLPDFQVRAKPVRESESGLTSSLTVRIQPPSHIRGEIGHQSFRVMHRLALWRHHESQSANGTNRRRRLKFCKDWEQP